MIRPLTKIFVAFVLVASLSLKLEAAYHPFTPDLIKVTNTALANVSFAAATQFNNINITAVVNTSTDVFTSVDSDGVNCAPGTYIVDVLMYQTAAASIRLNVYVEVTANGVSTGIRGASGYIRVADGHNEASAVVTDTVQLTSAGKIGFRVQRLVSSGTNVAVPVGQSMMRITRVKD